MKRNRAKTQILNWYDRGLPPQAERAQFSKNIDIFFDTLSERSNWHESLSTLLDDQGKADFCMSGNSWSANPSKKGLVVTSIVPGWSYGWRNVFGDQYSEDFFSWLGHLCRQYVHRSNICKVLMAAWERHGIILHPFGAGLIHRRYSDLNKSGSQSEIFSAATSAINSTWGTCSKKSNIYRSQWSNRNTLDPSIHQGIFHFLRGQSLLKADFELEALAAMDCVFQSLQYMDWSWANGNPKRNRRDLCKALGFGLASQDISEDVYFLRNQFAVHAGGWRWWDNGEYFEGGISEKATRISSRALRKAADIEPLHRRIDPRPPNWADWLEENFDVVWSAVWFREV